MSLKMRYHYRHILLDDIESRLILWLMWLGILLAELLLLLGLPVVGMLLYSAILQLLFLYGAYRWGRPQSTVLALAIPPVIRLVGMALPVGELSPFFAQAVIGAPLLATAVVYMRLFDLTWFGLQVKRSSVPHYVWITAVGGLFGWVLYQVRPTAVVMWDNPLTLLFYLIVLVGVMAFIEEWLFRGIMQSLLTGLFVYEWPAGLVVATLYTILHLGYASLPFLALIFVFALFLGWLRTISGSLFPVVLLHGAANIVYFLLLPWLAM